jgi:hypothetical protein
LAWDTLGDAISAPVDVAGWFFLFEQQQILEGVAS